MKSNYMLIAACIILLFVGFKISKLTNKTMEDLQVYKENNEKLKNENEKLKNENERLENENEKLHHLLKAYVSCFSYEVTLTAYTNRPIETNLDKKSAIMKIPTPGISVAVSQDLSHLLGKRVYIEGYGIREVEDLMNKRFKKRVDILVNSVHTARRIGKKENIRMVLIEPQKLYKDIVS